MSKTLFSAVKFFMYSLVIIFFLTGCAAPIPMVIHSADSMYTTNPMKRIAVFSSAYVVWPRTGVKQPVVDIRASKQSQEKILPLLQGQLAQKGYEVANVSPTGVAFVSPDINYNDFYFIDGGSEERKVAAIGPVFEYPILKQNPDLEKAVREFVEQLNIARKAKRLSSFAPDREAIKVIAKELGAGADTLCHMYVVGDKYSSARKLGQMLIPYSSVLIEDLAVELTCLQVNSAQVLWINSLLSYLDPLEPTAEFVSELIQHLPPRGAPLSRQIKRSTGGGG